MPLVEPFDLKFEMNLDTVLLSDDDFLDELEDELEDDELLELLVDLRKNRDTLGLDDDFFTSELFTCKPLNPENDVLPLLILAILSKLDFEVRKFATA